MTKNTKDSLIAAGVLAGILALFYLWPVYGVWAAEKSGQAALARANYSRQTQVAEARAKDEAAAYLAHAEVVRARGVDSAVRIIGGGLQEHPAYLRYLYIQELKETQNQIIYLPTEAGLPILEANRFKPPVTKEP